MQSVDFSSFPFLNPLLMADYAGYKIMVGGGIIKGGKALRSGQWHIKTVLPILRIDTAAAME